MVVKHRPREKRQDETYDTSKLLFFLSHRFHDHLVSSRLPLNSAAGGTSGRSRQHSRHFSEVGSPQNQTGDGQVSKHVEQPVELCRINQSRGKTVEKDHFKCEAGVRDGQARTAPGAT